MLNGQLFQFCFQFWTQLDAVQTWVCLQVGGTLAEDWENEKVEIPEPVLFTGEVSGGFLGCFWMCDIAPFSRVAEKLVFSKEQCPQQV